MRGARSKRAGSFPFLLYHLRHQGRENIAATSEAKKRANVKCDTANTRVATLKFNLLTDAGIIEKLESVQNWQGYIKALIRTDIVS